MRADDFTDLIYDPKTLKLKNGPWLILFVSGQCKKCNQITDVWNYFYEKYIGS